MEDLERQLERALARKEAPQWFEVLRARPSDLFIFEATFTFTVVTAR